MAALPARAYPQRPTATRPAPRRTLLVRPAVGIDTAAEVVGQGLQTIPYVKEGLITAALLSGDQRGPHKARPAARWLSGFPYHLSQLSCLVGCRPGGTDPDSDQDPGPSTVCGLSFGSNRIQGRCPRVLVSLPHILHGGTVGNPRALVDTCTTRRILPGSSCVSVWDAGIFWQQIAAEVPRYHFDLCASHLHPTDVTHMTATCI